MWGILQSNQTVGEMGPEVDHDDHNDFQGTNSDTNTTYKFSESAGPATMWGILHSNHTIEGSDPESDHTDTAAQDPMMGATDVFDFARVEDSGHEGGLNQNHGFPEPSGAATLWGILQSNTEEIAREGDNTEDKAAQDPITGGTNVFDLAQFGDNGGEGGVNENYDFPEPSRAATLWGILQSSEGEFSNPNGPAAVCGTLQSSQCEDVKDIFALTVGEPSMGTGSNESTTVQELGNQEPETREPEVEKLVTEPVQEEDCTQSKEDAGEEAAPKSGGLAPQAEMFYFDLSEIDVIGAQGSLDEPQGVSEVENSISHEAASPLVETTHDDLGNDEKSAEQGTEIGVVLDIQSESSQSTIFRGQGDAGLIHLSPNNDPSVPLDLDNDISKPYVPEEEIAAPATSPDPSGSDYIRYGDEIGGGPLQSSKHPDVSTQPTRSLPEPEVFDFPRITPKASSKSEAEIKAEKKADKKKAEHRRYKAKKKAEAAAKRRIKEEEEKEVAEEVEAPELPKTFAQIQVEDDARLGNRRLEQQAKRQEQQDRAASLRGLVRSSRAHLIY